METQKKNLVIKGLHRDFVVNPKDKLNVKLAMLIEGLCTIGVQKSIKKYNYTEQRFYQLLKIYEEKGTEGLMNEKTGPKNCWVRTKALVNQIIRYRFLDPDASPAVIAQKMKQDGHSISESSVNRTIMEYGLQKKTSISLILKRNLKNTRKT